MKAEVNQSVYYHKHKYLEGSFNYMSIWQNSSIGSIISLVIDNLSLKRESLYVVLDGPEFTMWTRLVSNLQRFSCLCLQGAGLKVQATMPVWPEAFDQFCRCQVTGPTVRGRDRKV